MRSGATLSGIAARGSGEVARPVVFIDGVPEPGLTVLTYESDGLLGLRSIVLDATASVLRPGARDRWLQGQVVVAQPLRLVDGQVRWVVLGAGRLGAGERTSAAGREARRLTLRDDWSERLSRPLDQVWWMKAGDALVATSSGVMRSGVLGNRSGERFGFDGREVYVLETPGEAWTVGEALETLSAWAGLDLSLALLPGEVARSPVTQSVDLSAGVGDALRRLLEPYGLVVQREVIRDGDVVIERRSVRPTTHGRVVRLAGVKGDEDVGRLVSVDGAEPAPAAEAWVARGSGWRVESTFELVPGWHPSSEGEADAAYGRGTSHDFARYGNAYRYWVLNEDGRFSGWPYERGAAFDLAMFFGEGDLRPQALPFRRCLTLDDAGEARPVVVEVSTDGGASWLQYPGQVRVSEHRAGVYLDDDVLPTAFLSAAKAGEARVRVTASLQSPQAVEVLRWRGNPFAGTRPARVFELGEAFFFERVAETSVHYPAIEAGQLVARQRDSRGAMRQWLVERLREQWRRGFDRAGRRRVTLTGVWLGLRVGDRFEVSGMAGRRGQAGVLVQRVRCRFDRGVTEVEVVGGGGLVH